MKLVVGLTKFVPAFHEICKASSMGSYCIVCIFGRNVHPWHTVHPVCLLHVLLEVEAVSVRLVAHTALVGPDVLVIVHVALVTFLAGKSFLTIATLVQLLIVLNVSTLNMFLYFMIGFEQLIAERTWLSWRFMKQHVIFQLTVIFKILPTHVADKSIDRVNRMHVLHMFSDSVFGHVSLSTLRTQMLLIVIWVNFFLFILKSSFNFCIAFPSFDDFLMFEQHVVAKLYIA